MECYLSISISGGLSKGTAWRLAMHVDASYGSSSMSSENRFFWKQHTKAKINTTSPYSKEQLPSDSAIEPTVKYLGDTRDRSSNNNSYLRTSIQKIIARLFVYYNLLANLLFAHWDITAQRQASYPYKMYMFTI